MESGSAVIFESEDLLVSGAGTGSQTLFLTFNNYNAREPATAFGEVFLRGRQYSLVTFLNKKANWSQTPDLALAIKAVKDTGIFQAATERVAYGASMGGFSALLLAGDLDCVRALVAAPQVSIDPRVVPFDTRFADEAAQVTFLRPDAREGMVDSCHYYILYDTHHEIDCAHIAMIGERRNITYIPVPFGGHRALAALQEQGALSDLVLGFARNQIDVHAIRRKARRNHGNSPTYLENLSRYCIARGRLPYAARVAARAFALNTASLTAYKALSRLYLDMNRYADLAQASRDYLAGNPGERAALVNLGIAGIKTGDHAAAALAYEDICRRDDATADDWFMLARMYARSGDAKRAVVVCADAQARFQGDSRISDFCLALEARAG